VAWSGITWLLVLFVVSLIVFIATASFSRKETIRGRLRPSTAEARIFAPEVGTLSKLHVALGDSVTEGQLLAEIATERRLDSRTTAASETLEGMRQERASLEARRKAVTEAAELMRSSIAIDLKNNANAIEQMSEMIELTKRRVTLAEERFASSKRLRGEGATSREEERVREDQLIVQRQQLVDLAGRLEMARAKDASLRIDLRRTGEDLKRNLSDVDQNLAQLNSQRARVRAEAGFVLAAPIAGRIAALQVTEGERVDPRQPVMAVLPVGGELFAETYVPSRAIAFVHPGQPVHLRYDALPYQKFGAARGAVRSVSETTFTPEELRATVKIEEPMYRVLIELDRQTMPAFGREVHLQSGMELSADIVLEKRRLMEWLLQPIYAADLRMRGSR
jgi:membrane fusion protein